MNKSYLTLVLTCQIMSQEQDTLLTEPALDIQNNKIQSLADSVKEKTPLPDIRNINEKNEKLKLGDPFFELKSSINTLTKQMDSLKKVISSYEKGKGSMPTIDEDLLNLIKIPQLRHRIELQNGTIVNGEIINENELGIIVQTSIGQLSIERDRIIEISEDISPSAKVELVNEPFVNAYPDKEEITGSIKNIGSKRADFVRVIVNLWSPTTELIHVPNSSFFGSIKFLFL